MKRRTFSFFVVAGIVVFFLIVCGCGKKENPSVQRLIGPAAISDLDVSREGDSIRLRFRATGKEKGIHSIRIVRNKLQIGAGECPGCPRAYEQVAELTSKDLQAMEKGNSFSYRDDSVERGYRYLYKIVVSDRDETKSREFLTDEVIFE